MNLKIFPANGESAQLAINLFGKERVDKTLFNTEIIISNVSESEWLAASELLAEIGFTLEVISKY